MDILSRTVIKEYEYAQVNLITDANGSKFIEKIQFHNPPVIHVDFHYDFNEFEIYESILEPLAIPHARVIYGFQNEKCTTFIMDFIEGMVCEDKPTAEHLYLAAEKIGAIYNNSKMNMARLDKGIVGKYTLSKRIILDCIKVISQHYSMPLMDSLIDYIYEKYQNSTSFVSHNDMNFKNFIYKDDLHLIDWPSAKISPFFSDLHSLIMHGHEVDADTDEIKKRYLQFAQISPINDEDIVIGGLIGCVRSVFELMIYDCPPEWTEGSYKELMKLIHLLDFH